MTDTASHALHHCSFSAPDEVREFRNGRSEVVNLGGTAVSRMVFEPGWRWSEDVKPIAGTRSCQVHHMQYHVSGRLGIRLDDGTEYVSEPGDVLDIPPGHDGWVVGDEPVVVIDWHGAGTYAKAE